MHKPIWKDGKSQRFVGMTTIVNIHPKTGVIVTSWETGAKTRKKYLKEKKKMIDVKFTDKEKALLNRFSIRYSENMDYDTAEGVLDIADNIQSLNEEDREIAEDIITKITTHPDW